MECPHLSSSVCIAPDSAKFPNGSPSSWCCSGECGPRRPCSAPEAPALPGLPSRGRGQSARGLGERCGRAGPGGWGGVRGEAGGAAAAAPLFPAARRSGRRRRGPRGIETAGATSSWGRRRAGTLACGLRPRAALQFPGVVLACVAGSGAAGVGVRPPQGGRTCGGARVASPPRPDGKSAAQGRSFVWAAGRAGALRYLPRTRFLSLPPMLRRLDPRRASGRRDLERCSELGRPRSESFISPGR